MKKIFISLFLCISISGCYETQKGEKIGTVIDSSYRGIIFKTNEISIIAGGIDDGTGAFSGKHHFSVENKETMKKVEKSIVDRKNVKILYHTEMFTGFWRGESNSFIDDIIFN